MENCYFSITFKALNLQFYHLVFLYSPNSAFPTYDNNLKEHNVIWMYLIQVPSAALSHILQHSPEIVSFTVRDVLHFLKLAM